MSRLLCLGEPLVELNARSDGNYRLGFGGDVSNVVIAATRQGANAGLIAHVGADRFGDDLVDLWDREGVDATYVRKIDGQDTGLYFVHHGDAGHSFSYRRTGSACSRMKLDDIPLDAIANAQMFYTSGISLAVSDSLQKATIAAMTHARQNKVTVAFDPNLRENLWPLDRARSVTHATMKNCDIALPGLDDARRLTGLVTPEDIIDYYHKLGARVVALTLGADGVAVSSGAGVSVIVGTRVDAVDATGAGDCFNGIFLANILDGATPEDAALNANIGAALSTTGFGAVAPIPFPEDIKTQKDMKT